MRMTIKTQALYQNWTGQRLSSPNSKSWFKSTMKQQSWVNRCMWNFSWSRMLQQSQVWRRSR